MALLEALIAASPIFVLVLVAGVAMLLVLFVVLVLAAALHPDRTRRADARRVLTVLLSASRRR